MKIVSRTLLLVSIVAASLLFVNCDRDKTDDIVDQNTFNFSAEDNYRAAQADNAVDGSLSIIENGYVEAEEGRTPANSVFPECATVTLFPNGNGGSIVLDFGTGCQLNNGAFVSGIINLEYGAIVGGTRTINYSFNNFTYNYNGVVGGGEIFRQIANENGNPQSTLNETITVSFPNTNVTATRNGMRVAVWVEGVGSGTWEDNVYHITGNWDTQFTNGFNRSGLVTETLVRRLNCPYLVSGLLQVTQNSFIGIIDWGNGECDNMATLEVNGQIYDIVL